MTTVMILRGVVINGQAHDVGTIVDVPDVLVHFLTRTGKARAVNAMPDKRNDDLTTETADAIVGTEQATAKPQRRGPRRHETTKNHT